MFIIKGEYIPTTEEAYDFFTRIYEAELEDEAEVGKVESKEKIQKADVQEGVGVEGEEGEEPKAGPSQKDHPQVSLPGPVSLTFIYLYHIQVLL